LGGGHDRAEARGDARGLDDGLYLVARGAGADGQRRPLGRVADRLPNVLVDGRPIGGRLPVPAHPLADHCLNVGMVFAEPRFHDLRIGESRQLVEVLLRRHRPSVLGEEVHEDLAEEGLVVRERPVEVEDRGGDRHG